MSTLPTDFVFTLIDQGADDALDSDVDPASGITTIFTLAPSQLDDTRDAGLLAMNASISNFVWDDLNGDGLQDAGELGVDDVTVDLLQPGADGLIDTADDIYVASTVTAGGGLYSFNNLITGDYYLRVSALPLGFGFTLQDQGVDDALDSDVDPAFGITAIFTLAASQVDDTRDAGLLAIAGPAPASISVWNDLNGNGIQDAGEPGVDGVTVDLLQPGPDGVVGGGDDILAGSTVTAGGGFYLFSEIVDGDYFLRFRNLPDGFGLTLMDQGSDDAIDSDADPITGYTAIFTFIAGENPDDTRDAGIVLLPAAIHGFKFEDVDANGIYDPAIDQPIEGLQITLTGDTDADGIIDTLTTTTDAAGEYAFVNIAGGAYTIVETLPIGSHATTPASIDITLGSGKVVVAFEGQGTLTTGQVELLLGSELMFGNTLLGSIHGFKFNDIDADGIYDDQIDTPLGGVTITLTGDFDGDGIEDVLTTITADGTGEYQFDDLVPGTYIVTETTPIGMTATTASTLTHSFQSGEELVAFAGQAGVLLAGQTEVVLGTELFFGNTAMGSIRGIKYNDRDADGTYDAQVDRRLAGVEILLTGDVDNDGLTDVLSTTTDAQGEWSFTNLFPGQYSIEEITPSGMLPTTPTTVSFDVLSGQVLVAVAGQGTTLLPQQTEVVLDSELMFGNLLLGSIHGIKFVDTDADGSYNPQIDGLMPAADIVLTGDVDGDGQIDTLSTTTDADGEYEFLNLYPGTYTITDSPFAGSQPTTPSTVTATILSGDEVVAIEGQANLTLGQTEVLVGPELMFGNLLLGSIHGLKFLDEALDGVYDVGTDQLLAGVSITLTGDVDGDGQIDTLEDVTDEDGQFSFTGLYPGDYVIAEVIPQGSIATTPSLSVVTVQSGRNLVAEATMASVLAPGQTEVVVGSKLMFGNYVLGSIGGFAFEDVDADGVYDALVDRLLGEVSITLTGDVNGDGVDDTLTTESDETGQWSFGQLRPDEYIITAILPTGTAATTPLLITMGVAAGEALVALSGQVGELAPGASETLVGAPLAFGGTYLGSIHGFSYDDIDGDGTYNSELDELLAGVQIVLSGDADGDGVTDQTTFTTDANGAFDLLNLFPGDYQVETTAPVGSVATTNTTASISIQSWQEYVAFAGQAGQLGIGQTEMLAGSQLIFGNTFFGAVHGFKFEDVDADGRYNVAIDAPLSGVAITLLGDADGDGQQDTLTTTTDAQGQYSFTDLFPGQYSVEETAPTGSVPTTAAQISLDIDSGDVLVAIAGQAGVLGTEQTQVVLGSELYFGNTFLGSIHGFKFEDVNANGVRDQGDGGLEGVSIDLLQRADKDEIDNDADGDIDEPGEMAIIATTTTAADGAWTFTGLMPGEYSVQETPPTGSVATTPTRRNVTIESGQELVADAGQASDLGPGQTEVVLGAGLLFGNTYLGSIHGFKFNDVDYNQSYNPEIDELLAGVTITLFGDTDGDGSFETQTAVTDANGEFGFINLYPGLYTVSETVPTNMAATTAPEFDVTVLSGQELVAYQGQAGQLGPGQTEVLSTDPLLIFGNTFLGSIRGEKFNDQDQNGQHDAGEPLANGYTIQLIDTSSGLVIAEQVTRPIDLNGDGVLDPITEQGQYAFENVFPGNYEIHEDLTNQGPETIQTFPLTPGFYTETVGPGETLLDRDFGNFSPIAKPDLIGHIDLAQLPDTYIPGDQVTIPLTVSNVGDASASGKISIEIYHSSDTALGAEDGSPIGTVVNRTINLAPGESIVIDVKSVIRADLTPGDYRLISSVDTTDVITGERSEANNIGASSDTIIVGLLFGNIGDRSNVKLTFTEADATEVTLTLAGGGTGSLVFNQQFGVFDLVIDGTDDRTSISVTASGGDGRAQFGDIIINGAGLRSFSAADVDVLGDVIIDRFVNTLTLGNVLEDHEIIIGTAGDLTADELAQSVTITLGNVEDTRINSAIGIKSLSAVQWLDNGSWADTITAPWIGTLDIDGDFQASLELSGDGDPKLTLGNANIGGDLSSGAAGFDIIWDITGDAGQINASNGTVQDWFLVLHSNISTIKLGLVESAQLSIGDEDADGKRGDIGTLSVAQWNDGSIIAGSIKSLISSLDKNNSQTHGDFAADLELTGPAAGSSAKVTLGSAKIGGDLGSGDIQDPSVWDIAGEIGTIDASAGQTEGWTLATAGNVSAIKLGLVEQAELTIGKLDADGKRSDLGTLSATQWNEGSIVAGSIKSLTTKQNSSIAGADGDFAADVELTGPAVGSNAKLTLGSAKFAGDLGSGDPQNPTVWDITGNIGTLDAANGTVNGFELELHSNIKTVNFGIVEDADLTIGDIDAGGHRGDAGTISAIAWRNGQIAAGSIKSLKISGDSKALIDGDFGASLALTGSSDVKVKHTLGSASIANEVGSGNAVQPAIWAIDGPIGKLLISGQVNGWQLDLANADLSALTLGRVIHAQVNVHDGNIGAIKTTDWLTGGIATGTIKSLQTLGDKSSADINGDFGASLELAGDAAFKLTLGSAKIGGDFGSPITEPVWDITGNVGAIDASKGTTDGWTLDVSGNLASLKLGLVEEAYLVRQR